MFKQIGVDLDVLKTQDMHLQVSQQYQKFYSCTYNEVHTYVILVYTSLWEKYLKNSS